MDRMDTTLDSKFEEVWDRDHEIESPLLVDIYI